jgi:hypothetical protein
MGITRRELSYSLGRRGNSLHGRAPLPDGSNRPVTALLEAGLLLYDDASCTYTAPEDIGERLVRELENTGCEEVEKRQRERDAKRRELWDMEYERFVYGDPPEENDGADILALCAQGEAERRELRVVPDLSDDEPDRPSRGSAPEPDRVEGLDAGDYDGGLDEEERGALEAVEAWESVHGQFSFTHAAWKKLFYMGPISGHWPPPAKSARIAAHMGRSEPEPEAVAA